MAGRGEGGHPLVGQGQQPNCGAVAGIDGGGTRTQCLVYDPGAGRLGHGLAGPINLNYVPRAKAAEAVRHALLAAVGAAGVDPGRLAAIAVAAPWTEELIAELAADLAPSASVSAPGEDLAALMGGLVGPSGLVLCAGTGSRCAYVPGDGEEHIIAGAWGSLFGDEGSGYDIGRRALQAVTLEWDGRGPVTALTRLLTARWELAHPKDVVHRVYGPPAGAWRSRIASVCPLVGEAALSGDLVALGVLREAAEGQSRMVVTVARRAGLLGGGDGAIQVLVSGGVFRLGRLILEPLEDFLAEHGQFELVLPQLPPVAGAMLLALAGAGFGEKALSHAVAISLAHKSCIMGGDD